MANYETVIRDKVELKLTGGVAVTPISSINTPLCNLTSDVVYLCFFSVCRVGCDTVGCTRKFDTCSKRPSIVVVDVAGLVQDCSNYIANALELLQSFTKPLIYVSG